MFCLTNRNFHLPGVMGGGPNKECGDDPPTHSPRIIWCCGLMRCLKKLQHHLHLLPNQIRSFWPSFKEIHDHWQYMRSSKLWTTFKITEQLEVSPFLYVCVILEIYFDHMSTGPAGSTRGRSQPQPQRNHPLWIVFRLVYVVYRLD